MIDSISVDKLLTKSLKIPDYQRPYKWDRKHIEALLNDINDALNEAEKYDAFKYRLGTIILYKNTSKATEEAESYDIIDGQQRIISLSLIKLVLENELPEFLRHVTFRNKISQQRIRDNYALIKDWFRSNETKKTLFKEAFSNILEVIIFSVDQLSEAFQLFDSQNTRGKSLDPHDLLKAYHLREMQDDLDGMKSAVTEWEAKDSQKIKTLFDLYLFPILNWSRGLKTNPFTADEIDAYKGIEVNSPYSYAQRTKQAMPCFQIAEPFIAGKSFFEMVNHYYNLLLEIKSEIINNTQFRDIKMVFSNGLSVEPAEKDSSNDQSVESPEDLDAVRLSSIGLLHAKRLFFASLLCYYDRFHNFDERAVKNLFLWAMMIRVDMRRLGFSSINQYAIGNTNNDYSNHIAIFSKIHYSRRHYEIANLNIQVKSNKHLKKESDPENKSDREKLYKKLLEIKDGKK